MVWDALKSAGAALAAVVHGDRHLDRVGPHLAEPAKRGTLAVLDRLSAGDRRRELFALTSLVRPPLDERTLLLPARARALVAAHVTRKLGRNLLLDVPPTRLDFAPSPELTAVMLRIARAHTSGDAG